MADLHGHRSSLESLPNLVYLDEKGGQKIGKEKEKHAKLVESARGNLASSVSNVVTENEIKG